jgi:hypothetical protein
MVRNRQNALPRASAQGAYHEGQGKTYLVGTAKQPNREQACGSPEARHWPARHRDGTASGPGPTNGSHTETRY